MVADYSPQFSKFIHAAAHAPHHNSTINTPLSASQAACKQTKATAMGFSCSTRCLFANEEAALQRDKWHVTSAPLLQGLKRRRRRRRCTPAAGCHRAVRKPGSKTCRQTGWLSRPASMFLQPLSHRPPDVTRRRKHCSSRCYMFHHLPFLSTSSAAAVHLFLVGSWSFGGSVL